MKKILLLPFFLIQVDALSHDLQPTQEAFSQPRQSSNISPIYTWLSQYINIFSQSGLHIVTLMEPLRVGVQKLSPRLTPACFEYQITRYQNFLRHTRGEAVTLSDDMILEYEISKVSFGLLLESIMQVLHQDNLTPEQRAQMRQTFLSTCLESMILWYQEARNRTAR